MIEAIIKNSCGYIQKRDPKEIEKNMEIFINCEKEILKSVNMHKVDFLFLRIQYLLTKLKTYVGLARISEFKISKLQWIDWFKTEVWNVFDDFLQILKESEYNN